MSDWAMLASSSGRREFSLAYGGTAEVFLALSRGAHGFEKLVVCTSTCPRVRSARSPSS